MWHMRVRQLAFLSVFRLLVARTHQMNTLFLQYLKLTMLLLSLDLIYCSTQQSPT